MGYFLLVTEKAGVKGATFGIFNGRNLSGVLGRMFTKCMEKVNSGLWGICTVYEEI